MPARKQSKNASNKSSEKPSASGRFTQCERRDLGSLELIETVDRKIPLDDILNPDSKHNFVIGQRVLVIWDNSLYYKAKVTKINSDESYDVFYEDIKEGGVAIPDSFLIPYTGILVS